MTDPMTKPEPLPETSVSEREAIVARVAEFVRVVGLRSPALIRQEGRTIKVSDLAYLLAAEAQVETATKALEPFAATAAVLDGRPKDDACWAGQSPAPPITFGDLRAAAAAYQDLASLRPAVMGEGGGSSGAESATGRAVAPLSRQAGVTLEGGAS